MNLLNEQLARAQCRDMLQASRQERLVRRALRMRRATRLARRADRLARSVSPWGEAGAAAA